MFPGKGVSIPRTVAFVLVALMFAAGFAMTGVRAAELVLFQSPGCPYCEAWDREIGKIYHLTDEARRLPLRRVDLDASRPADLVQIEDIQYTPTFVVMVEGREAGRIVGYSGEDQFWGLLGEIIAALPRNVN